MTLAMRNVPSNSELANQVISAHYSRCYTNGLTKVLLNIGDCTFT